MWRNLIQGCNYCKKGASFGAPQEDMKHIYTLFVRSYLEISSSVWHRNLALENETDLEQVQKSDFRIILGNQYISYKNEPNVLKLETLKVRRKILFRKFAIKSLEVKQMKTILKEKINAHDMETQKKEKL